MVGGHESHVEKQGGDFNVNDVPQGTQPHSSWVRFYAQKCKIFSPCVIKVFQQSLSKPASAWVDSGLPNCWQCPSSLPQPALWYRLSGLQPRPAASCCSQCSHPRKILTLWVSCGFRTSMGKLSEFTLLSSSLRQRGRRRRWFHGWLFFPDKIHRIEG